MIEGNNNLHLVRSDNGGVFPYVLLYSFKLYDLLGDNLNALETLIGGDNVISHVQPGNLGTRFVSARPWGVRLTVRQAPNVVCECRGIN